VDELKKLSLEGKCVDPTLSLREAAQAVEPTDGKPITTNSVIADIPRQQGDKQGHSSCAGKGLSGAVKGTDHQNSNQLASNDQHMLLGHHGDSCGEEGEDSPSSSGSSSSSSSASGSESSSKEDEEDSGEEETSDEKVLENAGVLLDLNSLGSPSTHNEAPLALISEVTVERSCLCCDILCMYSSFLVA